MECSFALKMRPGKNLKTKTTSEKHVGVKNPYPSAKLSARGLALHPPRLSVGTELKSSAPFQPSDVFCTKEIDRGTFDNVDILYFKNVSQYLDAFYF